MKRLGEFLDQPMRVSYGWLLMVSCMIAGDSLRDETGWLSLLRGALMLAVVVLAARMAYQILDRR